MKIHFVGWAGSPERAETLAQWICGWGILLASTCLFALVLHVMSPLQVRNAVSSLLPEGLSAALLLLAPYSVWLLPVGFISIGVGLWMNSAAATFRSLYEMPRSWAAGRY